MAKNNKSMNTLFGRRVVMQAQPDNFWPLPNELIGVEIEVEDLETAADGVYPEWTTHVDHSLRNGIEFVTSGPYGGAYLTRAINKFFDANLKYSMSPRTSTHLHVNASDDMTVDNFRNLFCIMYLIEPALFRWADENRKWCGYCSPLTDLEPQRIVSLLNGDDLNFARAVKGSTNQDRYYGLNVMAYNKHGTVEFRYFPCTDNRDTLVSWIKFVMYVKKACREYEDPSDFLARLDSREAIERFVATKFGEVAGNIAANLDFDDCLGRVKELRGMLNITPAQVKAGESYKTPRSKGLTKFLARTFPEAANKPVVNRLEEARAEARTAAEAFAAAVVQPRVNAEEYTAVVQRYMQAQAALRAQQNANR